MVLWAEDEAISLLVALCALCLGNCFLTEDTSVRWDSNGLNGSLKEGSKEFF